MELIFHDVAQTMFNLFLVPIGAISAMFFVVALLGMRKPRSSSYADPKKWPSVTVQIPTKNERVAIQCAKKCLAFDYPGKLQIIIGDDSTDPAVSKDIDKFAKQHPAIQVTRRGTNHGFKPGNLNYMLTVTKGEIIVIFDSDFLPQANFLREVVKPFQNADVACVQAKWDYLNVKQSIVSKMASSILMVYHHLLAPLNEALGVTLLFGSAEAVRTSTLKQLGGWKDWSMTEDVEYTLRALKNGYKTVYLKHISVPGEVPFNLRSLSKQQKRWAYGNAKAFVDNSRWIIFGRQFSIVQKLALVTTLIGYISAPFLVVFILLGVMTWFTGTPGIIDVHKFTTTTSQVFLINSGFLFATGVALRKERKLSLFVEIVIASLTYGIFVSISVFDGLVKALTNKKMQWYLIRKMGNEAILP